MSALRHPYRLDDEDERELAERLRLARADHQPVLLEIAGERYRLVPDPNSRVQLADEDDPFANYDPEKARAAIEAGFGAFRGLDVEAFLEEILEERIQDTPGHRF